MALTEQKNSKDSAQPGANDDGSIEIELEDDSNEAAPGFGESDHDENLAEYLDDNARRLLGTKLKEYVNVDEESRRDHMRRLKKGLEIIGLADIPNDQLVFEGAASVTHPALAEAIVQFQSRAIVEVFPPTGPVKTIPIDDATDDQEDQAKRIETYMNYQLTELDKSAFWNIDKMLFYLPFAGSAFKKCYFDVQKGMPVSRFRRMEDFIVPYDATSLEDASRYTDRYYLTANDLRRGIADGEFIEPKNIWRQPYNAAASPEDPRALIDLADRRTPVRHEDDSVYEICEMHLDFNFADETIPMKPGDYITGWSRVPHEFAQKIGGDVEDKSETPENEKTANPYAYPYIITFERESGEVLSIRRNWKEGDKKRRKQVWFVHYQYLPGFGFYGFGLLHLIGALGAAAGGALRLLLDGSLTSSMSGGFRTKEARAAGEVRYKVGEWVDVDLSAEEVAKAFYTPPFKEPTPALFKTLELIVGGIQRFASTTEAMVGDAKNDGPVGTTLALIEQGSKIFSAIHKRLHVSAREEFNLQYKLNAMYMKDTEYPIDSKDFIGHTLGEDFADKPIHQIMPVSDPNLWSHTMRLAQAQGVLSLIASDPSLYSEKAKRKAHREMLKALRVHDLDGYMGDSAFFEMDPVSENQAILTNTPVRAFPDQDHQSHLKIHADFLAKAGAALAPALQQQFQLVMAAHMAEHIGLAYRSQIEQELGIPLPQFDPHDPSNSEEIDPQVQNLISAAVAARINPAPPQGQPGQPGAGAPPADPQAAAAHAQDMRERQQQSNHDALDAHQGLQIDAAEGQAEIKRKDAANFADIRRKDAALKAELMRKGLIRHPSEITLASDMPPDGGLTQGPPPSAPPIAGPPPSSQSGAPAGALQ